MMSEEFKSNQVQEIGHSLNTGIPPQTLLRRIPNEFCRPLCDWPFHLCIIKDCVVVKNLPSIVLLTSQGRFRLPDSSSDKNNNLQSKEQRLQEEISDRLERPDFPSPALDENISKRFTDITAFLKSPKFRGSKFVNIGDVLLSELNKSHGADESCRLYCHETLDEIVVRSVSSSSSPFMHEDVEPETSLTVGDGASIENSLLAEVVAFQSFVNPGGIKEMLQVGDGSAEGDCGSTLICPLLDLARSDTEDTVSSMSQTSSCECSSSVSSQMSSQTSSQTSNQTSSQTSSQTSNQTSSQTSSQMSSQTSSQTSSQMSTSDEATTVQTIEIGRREKLDVGVGKRKANMRERKRIKDLSVAFTDLKKRIPKFKYRCNQISQLEILREAVNYINQLLSLLESNVTAMPPKLTGVTGSLRSRLFRCLANSKVTSSEPVVNYVNDDNSSALNDARGSDESDDGVVPMTVNEQLMLPMNVSSEDADDHVVGSGCSPVSTISFDCPSIGLNDDLSIWFSADCCFLTGGGMADEVPTSDSGY